MKLIKGTSEMAKLNKKDKEKIHNQLWFDLLDATENAEELGVPHAVHMGIQFFTRMALDCAPNEVEALGIIMEAIKVTKSSDELDELEGGSDEPVQS